MATTPIERLLFLQGNRCFFCEQPLAGDDASIEHLLAKANGGDNSEGNCVVCCKAVNRILGSKPLKDKFQVVLNQRGRFTCPDPHKKAGAVPTAASRPARPQAQVQAKVPPHYDRVLENLRKRGTSRPRTLARLKSSVSSLFPKGTSVASVDALLARLQTEGIVTVSGTKVTYQLK